MSAPRVLGLSCGRPRGSSEILLKEALRASEREGREVELVRVAELRLATSPAAEEGDDGAWLWERVVECDGLLVASPIISRTVAAPLKLLVDRLLGPNADAAIVAEALAARRAGREPALPMRADERVLRPRVAGFIAVGGSLTRGWKSLALPLMHSVTFSMQIAVADQVVFGGAGMPRSIVLEPAALERAAALGRNVSAQIGRPFERVEYRGEPGLCPACHLDLVQLRGTEVICAACGAVGELAAAGVAWTDLSKSVISMAEKRAHFEELVDTARRQAARGAEIEAAAARFDEFEPLARPPRPEGG